MVEQFHLRLLSKEQQLVHKELTKKLREQAESQAGSNLPSPAPAEPLHAPQSSEQLHELRTKHSKQKPVGMGQFQILALNICPGFVSVTKIKHLAKSNSGRRFVFF